MVKNRDVTYSFQLVNTSTIYPDSDSFKNSSRSFQSEARVQFGWALGKGNGEEGASLNLKENKKNKRKFTLVCQSWFKRPRPDVLWAGVTIQQLRLPASGCSKSTPREFPSRVLRIDERENKIEKREEWNRSLCVVHIRGQSRRAESIRRKECKKETRQTLITIFVGSQPEQNAKR